MHPDQAVVRVIPALQDIILAQQDKVSVVAKLVEVLLTHVQAVVVPVAMVGKAKEAMLAKAV
jgi:hypothetical protein